MFYDSIIPFTRLVCGISFPKGTLTCVSSFQFHGIKISAYFPIPICNHGNRNHPNAYSNAQLGIEMSYYALFKWPKLTDTFDENKNRKRALIYANTTRQKTN